MDIFLVKLKKAGVNPAFADFDEWPTLDELSLKIVNLFHIPHDRITITFRNTEKQFIDLTNDDALQEVYKSLDPNCKFIKFVVQDSQAPDTTISSTWSAGSHLSDLSKTEVFQLCCWVFNTSDQPFPINAAVNETVDDLKQSIKGMLEYPHPHFKLCLWKLSPSVPLSRYAELLAKFKSPDEIPGSIILGPLDAVSQHFLSAPTKHLHIIVVAPLISKRKAQFEPEEQHQRNSNTPEKKRLKLDDEVRDSRLPIEDVLKTYHEKLQDVESDSLWYSDPRNYSRIPFPFRYPNIPERFSLQDGFFQYMGRKVFQEVYKKVCSLKLGSEYTKLYIHGTMGYGKSYILAALACLLYREGKRVVFIPDCRALLGQAVAYIKSALLCAFADPSLEKQRERIRACTSEDEIDIFCHSLDDTLYFIVDQINAFDLSPPNMDAVLNGEKIACNNFINRISLGHLKITSASANYETALHMDRKQRNELKTMMMGGMRDEEMKQWWNHHEGELPTLDNLEKVGIEDLTGCIPLLLRPLLRFSQQNFHAVESDFWTSPEIVAVGTNIKEFAEDKSNQGVDIHNDYIEALFNCMTQGSTFENRKRSFDYRYFYANDYQGKCTCGIARQVAAKLVAQRKIGKFYESAWINTLHIYKDNPSALGFQVELICLSRIADMGLVFGEVNIKAMIPIWFPGNLDNLLARVPIALESDFSQLYFPLNSQFEDIDAAYVDYNAESNTLTVVPIQITISKRHKDSETLFYQKWSKWEQRFGNYNLTSTFLWIIENNLSWRTIMKQNKKTRNSSYEMPEHGQARITALKLHEPLGRELKRIRAMQYASGLTISNVSLYSSFKQWIDAPNINPRAA